MGKSRVKLNWRGHEQLLGKFARMVTLDDAKTIVRENGKRLTNNIAKEAVFVKGYSTGETKRSIPLGSGLRDGDLTAFAGPTTGWAVYPEYGTRFMEEQPYVKPGFEQTKLQFIDDLERLTK
ncbi:HK97-gp10 family putative phage morphogenesis protein [Facklamia sp. P9177]|uniref:HK97-gp10 family putative phage morphogenesis protein n=1 Tax=unclassified Facklamia TaxID=2622293 RepID=UPI003D16B411